MGADLQRAEKTAEIRSNHAFLCAVERVRSAGYQLLAVSWVDDGVLWFQAVRNVPDLGAG